MNYQLTKPKLFFETHHPESVVEIIEDKNAFQERSAKTISTWDEIKNKPLQSGDSFTVDFGDHYVGSVTLKIDVEGINDSPLKLQLHFAEIPAELTYDTEKYKGWLNSSWFYKETVNIDILPCEFKLSRRYAFRYVKVTVDGCAMNYKVKFKDIELTSQTSADYSKLTPLPESADPLLKKIDKVAARTLSECMQEVFEDGPKRDRRLWIGDMRLQALTNYKTFKNTETVKYCMYLFNNLLVKDKFVTPCLYTEPIPHPDIWHFSDYSLFFISCLYDYYKFSLDKETLNDLWPVAYKQTVESEFLFEDGKLRYDVIGSFFVDWCPGLDKYVSATAIVIFTLKQALFLANEMNDEKAVADLIYKIKLYSENLTARLFDKEKGCFISGGQISLCSQSWVTLADIMPKELMLKAMQTAESKGTTLNETTPYMKHVIVEAYWSLGEKQKAIEIIKDYWGRMVDYGADTFFELFNDNNHYFSTCPDATSYMLNSYCHAWSCTPSYFIRKYYNL